MLAGTALLMSFIVGLSVLAVIAGLRSITAPGETSEQLEQFLGGTAGASITLRELEMRASFYERAIKPVGAALVHTLGRMAPQSNISELQRKLETAGLAASMNVVDFLGLKILLGSVLAVLTAVLVLLRSGSIPMSIGATLLLGFLGFYLPNLWLMSRMNARQTEIVRALPDALDMMSICVNAGLGLQGAMQTVCENWDNALVDEFTRVLAEIRLGRSALESMENMGKRTGVKEVMSFVLALSMAHRLGISIAKVLPIQAEQMRIARRQKAEETARQASIKMLFPLVFLIFPAMFAVILGPAIPQIYYTFGSL